MLFFLLLFIFFSYSTQCSNEQSKSFKKASIKGIEVPPLYDACLNFDAEKVESLLESKADPNVKGPHGFTPLMAVFFRAPAELKVDREKRKQLYTQLVESGAQILTEAQGGATALTFAAAHGDPILVKAMCDDKQLQTHLAQDALLTAMKVNKYHYYHATHRTREAKEWDEGLRLMIARFIHGQMNKNKRSLSNNGFIEPLLEDLEK